MWWLRVRDVTCGFESRSPHMCPWPWSLTKSLETLNVMHLCSIANRDIVLSSVCWKLKGPWFDTLKYSMHLSLIWLLSLKSFCMGPPLFRSNLPQWSFFVKMIEKVVAPYRKLSAGCQCQHIVQAGHEFQQGPYSMTRAEECQQTFSMLVCLSHDLSIWLTSQTSRVYSSSGTYIFMVGSWS